MKKENILFGIIGLLIGLIVGFTVTNQINRGGYAQLSTQTANSPNLVPQVSTQVVRDQPMSGGMMPQVQQAIDRAAQEPNNFEAQMEVGEMYYRIQRFEEAAKYFEKASQIKPDDYEALVQAGNAYFDAGAITTERGGDGTVNFKQAEKFYATALTKKPDDVNVRTDLGLTYFYRKPNDLDRAIKEYKTSLETAPNHEMTLQSLASALKEKGDTAALQETLGRLEKVNPTNTTLTRLKSAN